MTKQISLFESIVEEKKTSPFINRFLFSDRIVYKEINKLKKTKVEKKLFDELREAAGNLVKNDDYVGLLEKIGYVQIDFIDDYQILQTKNGNRKALFINAGDIDIAAICKLISAMGKHGGDWGIISGNGKWRLFENGLFCSPDRWFEADVGALSKCSDEEMVVFSSVFGGKSRGDKLLLRDAIARKSEERTAELSERLSNAVRLSLELLITGFIAYENESTGAVPSGDALKVVLNNSIIMLHRIIYIFFAESRFVLPSKDEKYNKKIGLQKIISVSRSILNSKKSYTGDLFSVWEAIGILCKAVYHGDAEMKIPMLGVSLFDDGEYDFLAKNQIADKYIASVIEKLSLGEVNSDAWKDIPLDKVMESVSIPNCIDVKRADETMFLISEEKKYGWRRKEKARWKKYVYKIEKDCFYADSDGTENKDSYYNDLFYSRLRNEIVKCDHKFGPVLTAEAPSVRYQMNVADALAIKLAASEGQSFVSYNDACRETAESIYIVDDSEEYVETIYLGLMLFMLSDKPALYAKNRIVKGRIAKGVSASDLAGRKEIIKQLEDMSNDVMRLKTKKISGISVLRTIESGMKKIESKKEKLIRTFEKDNALSRENDKRCENMTVVHLPLCFPEVFYNQKRSSGFEMIITHTNAMAILRSDESAYLKKRLNIKGTISPYEAAVRRYYDFIVKDGCVCQIASRKYMKSMRARKLMYDSGLLIGRDYFKNDTIDITSEYILFISERNINAEC